MKRITINESQLHLISEINHLAEKSNVTICSLEDFKSLVSSMGINDGNVEQYAGQYCFIEIGSSYPRISVEAEYSNVNMINGQEFSPKEFYKIQQWYFREEHSNVIKLEFDDNQNVNNKNPDLRKDPTWKPRYGTTSKEFADAHSKRVKDKKNNPMNLTAVSLRKPEVKPEVWNQLGYKDTAKKTFYYGHGKGVDENIINRLKTFVDNNLAFNPDVKFVVHCRAGQSRSAAVGVYLANKIGQYTKEFLSEYGDQIKMPIKKDNGERSKRYPHQNMLNGLSKAEGWKDLSNKSDKTAADRWWYQQMINYLEKNGK
jgi:protein-tyrosine phosphatase